QGLHPWLLTVAPPGLVVWLSAPVPKVHVMARIRCSGCGAVQDVEGPAPGQAVKCSGCDRELRPRKKKRRRRRAGVLAEGWRYWTGAISPFGWGLAALLGLWLVGLALALTWPELGQLLLVVGSVLVLVGNVWIAF